MPMSDDSEKKSRQRPEFFSRMYLRMNGGTPERAEWNSSYGKKH